MSASNGATSGSSTYRDKPPATVKDHEDSDDDDDDLDDLDDVLASFKSPARSGPGSQAPSSSSQASRTAQVSQSADDLQNGNEGEDDFDEDLVQGMENLLRQLAGDHPPGVMPDSPNPDGTASSSKPGESSKIKSPQPKTGADAPDEGDDEAWERAVRMMLSGEGLDALGLDEQGRPKTDQAGPSTRKQQTKPTANGKAGSSGGAGAESFDETIRKTMEQLKNAGASGSGGKAGMGGGGMGDFDDKNLSALLAQLGGDSSALDGLGEGDDELGGLLDGMMAQLMTKEVLEEPMAELASKYPDYLKSPQSTVTPAELDKYKRQSAIVDSILAVFRKPNYNEERDGKEVARLVSEMQDLGGPPKEIMGDLPEGFDLGALGNEDGCSIM